MRAMCSVDTAKPESLRLCENYKTVVVADMDRPLCKT